MFYGRRRLSHCGQHHNVLIVLQLKDQSPLGSEAKVIILSLDPEAEQAAEVALLRACHVAPVEELAGRTVLRIDITS